MGRKRNKKGGKDDGNAAAEIAMEKAVQRVQVVLKEHSEQEIRETLLQCNLNHNVAIDRLLSLQDAKNKQGESNQLPDSSSTTTTSSVLVPNQSGLPNAPVSSGEAVPLSSEPSSSAITNGVTRSVPISSINGEEVLPSSSAITNGVTRSTVSISSNAAVLPSSRALTNVAPMAKAPVKADDYPLKPNATNPIFNSAFPFNQPMDTRQQGIATAASSIGPRPPTSMADAFRTYTSYEPRNKQQGMNSQGQVPSEQYGNMINSPYWQPNQNESYDDMAPFQQRGGGSNSNTSAHHANMMRSPYSWPEQQGDISECLNSAFAPYRNSTRPQSATSTVPSSHGSAYDFGNATNSRLGYEDDVSGNHLPSNSPSGSTITSLSSLGSAFGFDVTISNDSNSRLEYDDMLRTIFHSNSSGTSRVPSSHGSDYGRGMSSDNGSNSRLGYEDDISGIHMPSVQGSTSRLGYEDGISGIHMPSVQGSRSPFVWRVQGEDSYRTIRPRSQQQREAYFERINADLLASALDQEYNRRNQTQRPPRDK